MLTNTPITIFNQFSDPTTHTEIWVPTTIDHVAWFSETKSTIGNQGYTSVQETIIRIPVNADTGGKEYDPMLKVPTSNKWTLKESDIVVKGIVSVDVSKGITGLLKTHPDCVTIKNFADLRDPRVSKSLQHWKVVAT